MSKETIVALFGTRADANNARADLESSGVPAGSIDIRAEAGSDLGDADLTTEHRSFWDWLFGENGPEDRHAYRSRLSSGNVLLLVQPGTLDSSTIHDILHRHDPLDIDEEASGSVRGADASAMVETGSVASLDHDPTAPSEAFEKGQAAASRTEATEDRILGSTAGTTGDGSILEPRTGSLGMGAADDQPSSRRMDASEDALVGENAEGNAGEEGVIPVVQEDLAVGKRMVDRGTVRVRSYVMEQPVERQVDLRQETISVERRQPVTSSDAPTGAIEERVIEVTQRAEEPVVEKRARVKEEVVVRRENSSRTETIQDTVRGTEVEVERDGVLENRDR